MNRLFRIMQVSNRCVHSRNKTTKKMMSRGAKTPSQLEEKLAFKNESEDFRNELRRAMGYDDKYIRSDEQAEIYEHCAQMSSNLYHAPSAPTKIKQLKARKAKKDVSEHYYEYYDD